MKIFFSAVCSLGLLEIDNREDCSIKATKKFSCHPAGSASFVGIFIMGFTCSSCRRRRWEENIRMNLEEIGINVGNWVDSAQDGNYWRALVNAALNLRVT